MNDEIQKRLEELAIQRSTPFWYTDYIKCPTGRCPVCGSDDLMRITADDGPEYGTAWIYESILESELTAINTDEAFEDSIREYYPENVTVGWMSLDAVSAMKEMDPISWSCALAEWESNETDEGNIISLDGGSIFYWRHDIETLLESAQ